MEAENRIPAYMDLALPVAERVADLVARMTLDEKISQMMNSAPAIERLGIPPYNWWNEALHGVARAGVATVFPQAIGLASTWDIPLMQRIATAISDEARAKHSQALSENIHDIYSGLTFWSPNVNIFRDPRWGRGQETYGEDPYLTARMGVTFIRGLQEGGDPRYLKVVATAKHYAVHSGPEKLRHQFNAEVSAHDLWETYLPAFEACVREAHVAAVMGAYNRVDGEACCASPTLLEQILRREWGFDGHVVSDCGAIADIYADHRIVATPAQAAALAVKAGCDLECGNVYRHLGEAVAQGLIAEADIDRAVTCLFTARFQLGMFDPPARVPYTQIPYGVIAGTTHRELALQAARESIVLLRNEGDLLPLPRDLGSIAVIGPNADDAATLLGNYNGTPLHSTTPLEGIRKKVAASTTVYYARGCDIAVNTPYLDVIPSTFLKPEQGSDQAGLTGHYYGNPAFERSPAFTRVDPVVDFTWKGRTDSFAVRWNGFLIPPVSGTYHLGVNGYSAYRLYLDGELLVQSRDPHHPILRTKAVELEGGRLYRIRLDLVNTGLDPQVHLLWSMPAPDPAAEALAVAGKADLVVLVMGLSPRIEGEEMPVEVEGFQGGDRTEIALPRPQEELLHRIATLGKPVVLVLLNGSALAIPWAAEHIPAILEAWYPGEAGGDALADVLFGDYNPAGRLPVTFYRSVDDLPPFEDYRMEGHTYRYFRGNPLFPFGFGLSYTRFAYSNLRLSAGRIPPTGTLTIQVDVQNVGERAGDEVVQLYVSDREASVPVPIRQLQGFTRIHLAPGERHTVTFTLTPRQLSVVAPDGRRLVEPGEFQLFAGGRQPAENEPTANILTRRFSVTGHPAYLES